MHNSDFDRASERLHKHPSKLPEHAKTAHSTLVSLHRLIDHLDCVGDNDGTLRDDMITRARQLVTHLAKFLDFPKPYSECTATDICESLVEVIDFIESLPVGEPGPAIQTLKRAVEWIEIAGGRLAEPFGPGGDVKVWTPGGGRDAAA